MAENIRQCPATSIMAQPPFAGSPGIAEHDFRHRRALRLPLKPAIDKPRFRRRLHAGAAALDARLDQLQRLRRDAPVFLPVDLLDRVRPRKRECRDRQHLHDAGRSEAQAQAATTALRERCRHCQSTTAAASTKPIVSLNANSPSRHSAAAKAVAISSHVKRVNRKPIATTPNKPIATSALKVASATAP